MDSPVDQYLRRDGVRVSANRRRGGERVCREREREMGKVEAEIEKIQKKKKSVR